MTAGRSARGVARWACALAWAALLGGVAPAHALKFKAIRDNTVLLVYDCGAVGAPGFEDENEKTCGPQETQVSGPQKLDSGGVYVGDGEVLDRILARNSFSQVWLFSGGGNLAEGLKVGEVLRRYNQYVVVPDGGYCVSACTVAFLGGRVREVQPKASYEVHAYSGVSRHRAQNLAPYLGPDAEFALDDFVKDNAAAGKAFAERLFTYVQRMIGGSVNQAGLAAALASAPDFAARYRSSGQARADLDRIRREGATSAQEVLMRIERDAFNLQLAHLRSQADHLGTRAVNAAEILDIMFASRITGTYKLDQTTLKEKGYTNVRR